MPTPSPRALVPFVSVEDMMQLVHRIGMRQVLRDLAGYIEADFRRWSQFDKSPRIPAHSSDGVIKLMPTSDGDLYAFKYVNGHPKNFNNGLQTVMAIGLLADVSTGAPMLLSEMTLLTALRTAATSALAARHLARPDSHTMALIGNGAQAEFQAVAFQEICGVKNLRLYDIDRTASEKVVRNLRSTGLSLEICANVANAVMGADIVTTCTADKRAATILTDNHIGAGVHINAVGGDCPGKTEMHPDILRRSEIFVEYAPQTRIEGEIQNLRRDHPVTEIWEVISQNTPGRSHRSAITLFDSVGFAIEDFSALRYIRDKVQATESVSKLDLLADPDDPRDLFGMLQRNASLAAA